MPPHSPYRSPRPQQQRPWPQQSEFREDCVSGDQELNCCDTTRHRRQGGRTSIAKSAFICKNVHVHINHGQQRVDVDVVMLDAEECGQFEVGLRGGLMHQEGREEMLGEDVSAYTAIESLAPTGLQ